MPDLNSDISNAFNTVMSLDDRLRADTWRCHASIQKLKKPASKDAPLDPEEAGFLLRTYLRVFFAHVEGLTYAMRRAVLALARLGHFELSEGEVVVLSERRYYSQGGRIRASDSYNIAIENLELAFHYFPLAFGAKYALAKSDHRWEYFTRSWDIRNRLSHPKRPEDLDLEPKEIGEFADAFSWFAEQVKGCFRAILEGKYLKPAG